MKIEPLKEGCAAYYNGVPRCLCPYGILADHSERHEVTQWHRGWIEAEHQSRRLFGKVDTPDAA